MNTFIELTRVYQQGTTTKTQPILLNVALIGSVRPRNIPDEAERTTRTTLKVGGSYINVAQKYSEVLALIEGAISE